MGERFANVSDSELAVLKALWALGQAKVAQIRSWLQELGYAWAYNTVQTLLHRLESKGYVTSSKDGRALVYLAELDRTSFLNRHLDDLAEKVCEGGHAPMVLALVQGRKFSKQDIEKFRDMLDRLDEETN